VYLGAAVAVPDAVARGAVCVLDVVGIEGRRPVAVEMGVAKRVPDRRVVSWSVKREVGWGMLWV